MNDKTNTFPRFSPPTLFLSLLGVGYLSPFPGTLASLVFLIPLYFISQMSIPFFLFIPFVVIATAGSSVIVENVQKKYNLSDPSWIVVDEAIGITVAWFFLSSPLWWHFLIIFILFRFFDITKLWPIGAIEKMGEHGVFVILDDILAGLFAGLCYRLIILLLP